MTAARIGSLSTHTASPPILERMEVLANDVFDSGVAIENRLVKLTKPEVVAKAVELGRGDLMIGTVSCWQIGRTRTHCGICSPCIMRRISNEYNGVADIDYDADIFDDASALDETKARDNLSHFISLIEDLQELSDVELEYEYPEILRSEPAMTLNEVVDLHRRWAQQAASVLFNHPVPRAFDDTDLVRHLSVGRPGTGVETGSRRHQYLMANPCIDPTCHPNKTSPGWSRCGTAVHGRIIRAEQLLGPKRNAAESRLGQYYCAVL